MEQAICYKDRNNTFWIYFYRNNILLTSVEMAAITKFEIKYLGTYYNSVDHPTGFTLDGANGRIKVKPKQLDLPLGKDLTEILIYDAGDNIDGLYWNTIELSILGNVMTTTVPPTTIAPTTIP